MITAGQRDVLYQQILDRLSGIGDIWPAATDERHETADRLGREYSDELCPVLDDLGWGDGPSTETIELTASIDVLRQILCRLLESARSERARKTVCWAASRQDDECNRLVSETCEAMLGALEEGQT